MHLILCDGATLTVTGGYAAFMGDTDPANVFASDDTNHSAFADAAVRGKKKAKVKFKVGK